MKQLKMSTQLYLLAGVLTAGIVIVGILGVRNTNLLSKNLSHVIDNTIPVVRHLTLVDMVHDGVRGAVLEAMLGVSTDNASNVTSAESTLQEHEANVSDYFKKIHSLELSPESTRLFQVAESDMSRYLLAAHNVINVAKKKNQRSSQLEFAEFEKQFKSLESSLSKLGEYSEEENKNEFDQVMSTSHRSRNVSLLSLLGTTILGVLMAILIARSLSRAVGGATSRVVTSASKIRSAIEQLSGASQDLSSSATEQAAALQETAASIEEISAMVRASAENASRSESASNQSRAQAERGQAVVQQMLDSIKNIGAANERAGREIGASARHFADIVKVIEEIGSKTKVINDIVFQTKILSFNASVEAARAGEHGKGFTVVAEEVGKLAAMSGVAAHEIGELLSGSIQKVDAIVKDTQTKVKSLLVDSASTIAQGTKIANECTGVLNDIVSNATHLSEMITAISSASQEQANGVTEISRAIQQLDQATQTNASAAASCAETARQLGDQTGQLAQVSSTLTAIVTGSVTPQERVDAPPAQEVFKKAA